MPEVSEIEIIRHFTRISTWNYGVDTGLYPLGSCTMKYNPRINEIVARLDGLANAHPYQPEKVSQGALLILQALRKTLMEICGMDAITLQPAAGAHGELTGILLVRAYLQSKGNPRKKILIPDSAHGTNPATAAIAGYEVENLKSNARGMVDIPSLEAQMNEDVAALMVTNPNTLGVFEQEIHKIADIVHRKGGAAVHGRRQHECPGRQGAARRFRRGRDAPEPAQDVLHTPRRRRAGFGSGGVQENSRAVPARAGGGDQARRALGFDYDRPQSIGRVRAFYGNFGMHVRALAYIMANGRDGLRQTTEDAVVNANYIRKKLRGVLRPAVLDPEHARGGVQRPQADGEGHQDRRHREAADRLRIPPVHGVVPADRARGADDRAHGERVAGRVGSVH